MIPKFVTDIPVHFNHMHLYMYIIRTYCISKCINIKKYIYILYFCLLIPKRLPRCLIWTPMFLFSGNLPCRPVSTFFFFTFRRRQLRLRERPMAYMMSENPGFSVLACGECRDGKSTGNQVNHSPFREDSLHLIFFH